jgi:putative hemolysin
MRPEFSIDSSLTEVLAIAVDSRYSRIPVFSKDIDNIIGIVYCKDLLEFASSRMALGIQDGDIKSVVKLKDIVHPVFYVPETMTCWAALQGIT